MPTQRRIALLQVRSAFSQLEPFSSRCFLAWTAPQPSWCGNPRI